MPSPNIWHHTATYEIENRAFDRPRLVESAMRSIAPWAGRTVLDLGCGTGYHLPTWAQEADAVIGVEPHADLLALARRRTKRIERVRTLRGTAQETGLPDSSVDVVHARWAYFFGPGCEPGLTELDRVVRRGGTAFVIDNDPTTSTFGGWFARGYPYVMPERVEAFWSQHGWTRTPITTTWEFDSRADLEAVVGIEFTRDLAQEICRSHAGTTVDYAVNLWHRHY
ncbi:class I SAM-dependent methyltransferase [Nocardioides dubius]